MFYISNVRSFGQNRCSNYLGKIYHLYYHKGVLFDSKRQIWFISILLNSTLNFRHIVWNVPLSFTSLVLSRSLWNERKSNGSKICFSYLLIKIYSNFKSTSHTFLNIPTETFIEKYAGMQNIIIFHLLLLYCDYYYHYYYYYHNYH